MKKKDIFKEMAEAWGRPLVPRMNVDEFSGGLLHPRTMANLDSLGEGPKRKVKMGRKVAYEINSLIEWMRERCSVEEVEE